MVNVPDHARTAAGVPLLVGRERELGMLRDQLRAALDRRGGLVLIGGAAGIGKTALARAIGEEASLQDVCVLTGRCYDLAETPPYGPWREILGDAPAVPGVALPAPFTADASADDMPSQMTLFARVRDFLTALAAQQPLLLVLEDLHWVDPASLDLLRFLSHSARAAPLLLLGTYRGDELDRAHPLYQIFPALVREADVTRVDLAPLTRDAIRSLVHARYALADEDERRLAAYLTVRSEGNALFCIELMRTLEEEGFLHLRDSDWTLHDLTRARVPLLLRQVIAARLARLGAEADRLLSVAAIIGSEAPLDLWGTVSDTEEDVLLDLVERAVAARVLDETADGNVVRFAHALIRDSLYEGMLASRRRVWHRRIAEAMAATPQPDPDAVAYHFRQAGDARAVGWFVEAGERAQRAYAHMTAGDRFEAALALMRDGEPDPRERGWLLYRLVVSRRFERNPQAIAQLDEAARLAAEAGDRALAAHVLYYKGHLAAHALDLSRALVNIEAALVELESLPAADTAWLIGRNIIEPGTGWGTFINWLACIIHKGGGEAARRCQRG